MNGIMGFVQVVNGRKSRTIGTLTACFCLGNRKCNIFLWKFIVYQLASKYQAVVVSTHVNLFLFDNCRPSSGGPCINSIDRQDYK